jgi:hypothetical protein
MTIRTHVLAAAAAIGSFAAPAAAQDYPQQPAYPQSSPQDEQQGFGQQASSQSPIQSIIDGLLGNRYNGTDRQAVSQCASAAMTQATTQYGENGYAGSDGYAGYAGAYRPGAIGVPGYPGIATSMRVSAITAVQRRSDGMRVKGLIDSGVHYRGGYGGQAYQGAGAGGQAYAARYPRHDDLSFRCNLDNRGIVTSMRVDRNNATYRRF